MLFYTQLYQFPGVVPRTFTGAICLSALSYPFALLASQLNLPKAFVLAIVRLSLVMLNSISHGRLAASISTAWGSDVGAAFSLLTISQFHIMFYMSRPLPNTFALVLVTAAWAEMISKRFYRSIVLLCVAAVVFRCDIAILCVPIGVSMLLHRRMSLLHGIVTGITTAALAIALSVLVDSTFWGRTLWPEGVVLFYNTVLNKSSNWGVSPPLWYFYSALPRALMGSLSLVAIGMYPTLPTLLASPSLESVKEAVVSRLLFVQHEVAEYVWPAFVFIALYSLLPHKELRFIFPALPMLTGAAAVGLASVWRNRSKSILPLLFFVGIIALSFIGSALFLVISSQNYPGGVAFLKLHSLSNSGYVHIDVAAAQTGISRYGESRDGSNWRYSKDEELSTPVSVYISQCFVFINF
jgi:alpha-1,6-mannosyltransferase